MVLKNGIFAGWLSIWWFRWRYAEFSTRLGMFVAMCVFVVSLISFILRFMADQSFGVWGTIALLGSLIGLFLSTKSVIYAFHDSSRELKRFKDRGADVKRRFAKTWMGIEADDLCGFKPKQIACKNIYGKGISDYAYVYPDFDQYLVKNSELSWREVKEGDQNCCQMVCNHLDDAQQVIALRKKRAQYKDFYNEDKINLVEFKRNVENGVVELNLSKTCYYTSYLSVEFYRDCVQGTCGKKVGFGDIEQAPFIDKKLPPLKGNRSLHLGANTIAITKDGSALFWQQVRGDHSNNLWSMSGMGSMDYEDLRAGANSRNSGDFNLVIKKAAERELTEEMFKGQILNAAISKLPVIGEMATRKSIKMDTRIIGFFRWVALGGLPGFICVTKLDKTLDDLRSNNLFGLSEGAQDEGGGDDLLKINSGTADDIKKSIDEYIKKIEAIYPMSLPLCVAFDTLKRAVDNEDFLTWLTDDANQKNS